MNYDSFHLLAFAGAALDASAGDVKVNAVADPLFMTNNNNFRMPSQYKLQFAYAGSVGATRARVVAPQFRIPAYPQIVPVNAVLIVPTRYGLMDFRDSPLEINNSAELSIEGTNAAANTFISFVGVTKNDVDPSIPKMGLRWARFTASVTGGTLAWGTPAAITFQDTLDSGIYGVYGMQVAGTTVTAARLVFNNQYHRPGSIGFATPDLIPHQIFMGGMGLWGQFENSTPPMIELFQSTGSAITLEGRVLLQKLSGM